MTIRTLELKNFRNYRDLHLSFDRGTNILYGDNAQGKTNILESLYVSGTSRSHRGSRDREMILFDENEAHIRVAVDKRDTDRRIDFHLKKNSAKGIAVDGVPIRRVSDLFGLLHMVFFSPEDLNLIKNAPSGRRRFLDMELSQMDRIYLDHLSRYQRALKQRNQLLKDIYFRPDLEGTLFAWDEQIVSFGTEIIEQRGRFLEEMNEIVSSVHGTITGGTEQLILKYEPECESGSLREELERARQKDIRTGMTSRGPHRDDICFSVNGVDIRKYGSQGQQRTAALSLKLAEIGLVKKKIHDTPVLLLDDVLSELDSKRQNYLLNSLSDTQTIMTCTGLDEFVKNRFQVNKVFYVKKGTCVCRNKEIFHEHGI